MTEHLGEVEYESLLQWLVNPDPRTRFDDPTNQRLVDVWSAAQLGTASSLEIAVLLRQQIRRTELRFESSYQGVEVSEEAFRFAPSVLESTGLRIEDLGSRTLAFAKPWTPKWLKNPLEIDVDSSAASGVEVGLRARPGMIDADRAFEEATSFSMYKSPGQRAAVRCALELPLRGVLIANLPTGSGKTEVALTLARKHYRNNQSTIMVVPTISLAQDLETRLRRQWGQIIGANFSAVPFGWTSETSPEVRAILRERIENGQQPVLVTSPESLEGALSASIRVAGANGRLAALIVDEAHLVTQWGRGFRPAYRLLGKLWSELNTQELPGVRMVLLSATFGDGVLEDLIDQFPTEGGPSVVAANALRPEPQFWVADSEYEQHVRDGHVVEALSHLPRPAILYVTKPRDAMRWQRQLRTIGYRRLAVVTGSTDAAERRRVLEGLRTSPDGRSKFDFVVATSAFGLGIDADELRTVIHACLPETTDRWYQEVGRAGRDGYSSTAMLVPWVGDVEEAAALGATVLTPEKARERWSAIWHSETNALEDDNNNRYVNLAACPTGNRDGSYNRFWNAQVLEGLEAIGSIIRTPLANSTVEKLFGLGRAQNEGELADAWFQIQVVGELPSTIGHDKFDERWKAWKDPIDLRSQAALSAMRSLAKSQRVCYGIAAAYDSSESVRELLGSDVARGFEVPVPCGRCQACAQSGIGSGLEPAPEPTVRWHEPAVRSKFEKLVTQRPFLLDGGEQAHGVTVCEVAESERDEALTLLRDAGALLGVNVPGTMQYEYLDGDDYVAGTLPFPAVIVLEAPSMLLSTIRALQFRWPRSNGSPAPAVVLVESVPRDLRLQVPMSFKDLEQELAQLS